MQKVWIIIKKELQSYFNSPIAYIFLGIFLLLTSWLFFQNFFLIGQASVRNMFFLMPWMMLFLVPAITMRSWAEEKKSGTIELLLTFPVKDWQVVLAKYFSGMIFLFIGLVLLLVIPITAGSLGNLDWGPVIGSYLAVIFLSSAFMAVGLYISSLTNNQIVAFLLTAAACFGLFILSYGIVVNSLGSLLGSLVRTIGLSSHYDNLIRGVLDLADFVYFIGFSLFFLYLNMQSLNSRNWK